MLSFFKRRNSHRGAPNNDVTAMLEDLPAPVAPMERVSPFREPSGEDDGGPVLPQDAYTNGFESIYALENVDVRTVRPLGSCTEDEEVVPTVLATKLVEATPKQRAPEFLEDQLQLDLGNEFQGWIEPLRMGEPIQVLALSAVAQRGLIENGRRYLRDLLDIDRKTAREMKGIGQGHIDEVIEKLNAYLEGWPRERSDRVDFSGLVMCIVGAADHKGVHLWLSDYGLQDLVPLNAAEQAEARHLNAEQRAELIEEVSGELTSEKKAAFVKEKVRLVLEVFVKPWIRGRHGMATTREITERLERVSCDGERAPAILKFLTDVYFSGKSPYGRFLTEIDPGVFVADRAISEAYRTVRETAKSYFYRPTVHYQLPVLESYLAREAARRWRGFADGFIAKVLRNSPLFRVRKGPEGVLNVRQR